MASTAHQEAASALGAELKTSATTVLADQAEQIAREKYGFVGRAEWLWGEKDSNYRLTLDNGSEYLLKILNPAENPAMTSMHSQALLHVEAADPGIPIQRIIRTLDGEADFRMTDDEGATRGVRMVTFVPGNPRNRSRILRSSAIALVRCWVGCRRLFKVSHMKPPIIASPGTCLTQRGCGTCCPSSATRRNEGGWRRR